MKLFSGILGLTLSSVVALATANAADLSAGLPAIRMGQCTRVQAGLVSISVSTAATAGARVPQTTRLSMSGTHPASGHECPCEGARSTGRFWGGQIGYNWQKDHLVIGVEADIQAAAIEGNASSSFQAVGLFADMIIPRSGAWTISGHFAAVSDTLPIAP